MDPNNPTSGNPQQLVTPQLVSPASSPGAATGSNRRRGGFGKVLFVLLFLALIFSLVLNVGLLGVSQSSFSQSTVGIDEVYHSLSESASDKIAIISITGVIMDGNGSVKKQIDRAAEDENVKAVILRINSPGGTVTGSDFLYHHLTELREERDIPIVVSMGSIAASGGYYVAMAAGETERTIFAEPTCWTGSVGVIIPHYNISGLMKEWEIEEDSIKSHPLKQLGSMTREMTEQERAILQALVDDSFQRFKEVVMSGRPAFRDHPEKLDEVATGQVFTTGQAIANGLVDEEGFIEDAILRAAELAGLSEDEVRVVQYRRRVSFMETVLLGSAPVSRGPNVASLLELTSPRAYYLYTWLPGHQSAVAR